MMATIEIDDELARKLGEIAARRGQTIADFVQSTLSEAVAEQEPVKPTPEALEAFLAMAGFIDDELQVTEEQAEAAINALSGLIDEDVTDLSETVRETMDAYYRKKYGDSA